MSWQFFTDDEMRCRCGCGRVAMNEEFMRRLIALREEMVFPFVVTSGYRCPEHNDRVSTTGPTGPHTTGRAVDIAVYGGRAYRILAAAPRHGFTGIGVSQKGDSRFLHLDDLIFPAYPRPTVWSY